MGSLLSDEQAQKQEDSIEAEMEMLMSMATKQKEIFINDLTNHYSNPENFQKYEVVGGRMTAASSVVCVSADSGANADLTAGINGMIDGIFGVSGTGDDDDKEEPASKTVFKDATENLVTGAFNAIFGNASASECQASNFFILPFGYTFYRIDTYLWKYNVNASAGMYSKTKACYVSVAGAGILDHTSLTNDELIGFISQIVGSDKDAIIEWISEFTDIMNAVKGLELSDQGVKQNSEEK